MSNELKPCPFCGRTEAKLTKCRTDWVFGWHVTCKHCLSVGATAYSDRVGVGARTPEERERAMKAYAVANWNRRTTSDHIVAANKKVDDNHPLTLEELREMDGEPVYIVFDAEDDGVLYELWALVNVNDGGVRLVDATRWNFTLHSDEDLRGMALYSHKPDETVTNRNDLRRKTEEG